ncbi:SMI1/KNR4 family protein [Undibacterium sp. TS12]|uniref:SMI1/KNR4 family protein n=1 Tax=Undibacterium sp. TS12 TaxID=2908202 RepID=UPI001F4C87D5|nr:SMI1/KNR4 family protein [Undibacterium sp. TS12]MCH8620574.1 SMI1/KNR4 family protein [Undibacterium sp. TS12]
MLPENVIAFERQLDCRLDDVYREFLLSYGASTFAGKSVDHPHVGFRSIQTLPAHITSTKLALFNAFYGDDQLPAYSLLVRHAFYLGRLPQSMIPIADDGGAGQICLGISGEDKGKIFYWDQRHEAQCEEDYMEDFGEPRPPEALRQNLYLVALTFIDFLKQLELMPETI